QQCSGERAVAVAADELAANELAADELAAGRADAEHGRYSATDRVYAQLAAESQV
ncbi:hypothetical protein LPJ70_002994, partial [Coemansia sp. RSA 2708]